MHWFLLTIISGWGNVDPVTFPGVVSTAYTTQVARREALYETEIREVLADGVVSEEEEIKLKNMQAKYGMSDEQVEAIAAQVRAEKNLSV